MPEMRFFLNVKKTDMTLDGEELETIKSERGKTGEL